MLRLSLAVSLMAIFGCGQPDLPPVAGYDPAEIVRAAYYPPAVVRGRPIDWCADARPNDPLLLDGIELASYEDNDGSILDDLRTIHRISPVPAEDIALITDETVCEQAARSYDAARFIYRYSPLGQSVEPVFVVSLGRVYLVESAGDRERGYEVKVFDRSWKHLRGGFGVEF